MSRTAGREPRDDVLTGLATATFPDGTMPEVGDVVRVATNVFSAGQETTVRLLSTALKVIGDHPDIQRSCARTAACSANFIEECLRIESPVKGDFRLSRVPTTVGEQAARCRLHGDGDQRRRQPRPAPLRGSRHASTPTARTPVSTWRSGAASTAAPARRWLVPRPGSGSSDCSTAPPTSGSRESKHGPAGDRSYNTSRPTSCVG